MMISIVVAASSNNVIGAEGGLPWRISDDLKRFKQLTMGKPVVMGRLTWDSIDRPLPGRHNIVITRQHDFSADGCTGVASPAAALKAAGDAEEVMIIGGRQIYDLFLPSARRLYLTRVHANLEGDTFFPEINDKVWHETSSEFRSVTALNEFDYEFRVYDKKD